MPYTDFDRLESAYTKALDDLLAEGVEGGHWVGELASSALATATAVSALALVQGSTFKVQSRDLDLRPLIEQGIAFLTTQQNADGGFGDTDLSHSNIATTMLVRAAFHLAGAASHKHEIQHKSLSNNGTVASVAAGSATLYRHRELLDQAAKYVEGKGGVAGLRARYGKDKTFAVPILTNCALAGLVDWRAVSPLPFELAAFPQSWYRFFRLPVVSYAIPALVAIGQARYFHRKPRNPLVRAMRAASVRRTLMVLERMQADSGGYLEAIPLTSFVVMSLAGSGRADHPVAQRGTQFLLDTLRPDGSWPIDTNLATWVTTLAINAIEGSGSSPRRAGRVQVSRARSADDRVIEWLLSCQHSQRHPFTGAAPGGWGWSDLSGAVPDVDDTSGALLVLATHANCRDQSTNRPSRAAALNGIHWLLNVQNKDGGSPTFSRGWGTLPFDRSAPDLTAHAMRAIVAWISDWKMDVSDYAKQGIRPRREFPFVKRYIERALNYLETNQRSDGCWVPLWFGNQDRPAEENPVYGTSRVLLAYRDLGRMNDDPAVRGVRWLIANRNADGGWGSAAIPASGRRESPDMAGAWPTQRNRGTNVPRSPDAVLNAVADRGSSVEETAWAVEGLLAGLDNRALAADNSLQSAIRQGVDWLVLAVEDGRHRQPAPVGFYFAKLWYYERLYPLVFTVASLGEAVSRSGKAVERTIKWFGNVQENADK